MLLCLCKVYSSIVKLPFTWQIIFLNGIKQSADFLCTAKIVYNEDEYKVHLVCCETETLSGAQMTWILNSESPEWTQLMLDVGWIESSCLLISRHYYKKLSWRYALYQDQNK